MNQTQIHRGPDDEGIFRDRGNHLSLGVRRLAIVDIAYGHQPMTTSDGRFTIVFNGEIFNAPALRANLEKQGKTFATDHSDTEVVLQLYAERGEAMLSELNGMFAFAIFDREKKLLFCARDHMGIKPLYYVQEGNRFIFASELKSLLALPWMKRELNPESLFHYMSLMYVPGEQTILKNIKRLPKAHSLTYRLQNGKIDIRQWWKPHFGNGPKRSISEWRERIRESLSEAVKRWTLSDVPLACSLSGGLDSSSIVGLLAQAGQKIKTYTLGFTGASEEAWNELPRARSIANLWSTDHHELVLKPEDLLDDLIPMVWALDEPYAGGLPSWKVFQFMSKEVKVGLTGTGGDELFGNYGKWRFLEKKRFSPFPRREKDVGREEFRRDFFERFYYFSDRDKYERLFADSLYRDFSTNDFLYNLYQSADAEEVKDRVTFVDLATQLSEEFLMMTDRFSMAHSLEARTPFLDREFVELVLSIPSEIRTKPRDLKYLLRESVADILPKELRHAPKKGFVIPLTLWLRSTLRPLVEYLLNPERLKRQGIFKPEFYEYFVKPHLDGKRNYTNKIWAAVMFQLWYFIHLETNSMAKPSYHLKTFVSS